MRMIPLFLLLTAHAFSQGMGGKSGMAGKVGLASGPSNTLSWTLIQHPTKFNCTTASCTLTVTSTTAGNLLVLMSDVQYVGTGFAKLMYTSAPTGTSETWVHATNYTINDAASSDATLYAKEMWYALSSVGGTTSITIPWTLSGLTTSSQKVNVEMIEYHPSITPIFYDTGNALFRSSACSTCGTPAGLNSGAHDVVVQSVIYPSIDGATVATGVGSPYSSPTDLENTNHVFSGFAGALNQSSYTTANWTSATSIAPVYLSTASFGENASPTLTANILIDFSGCTNGSALTTTCVGNSTFTGWDTSQDASEMGPGVTATTDAIGTGFTTTTINGVQRTGSSTLNFHGVTAVSGTNIGKYNVSVNSQGLAQFAIGFTIKSSCTAAADCGATVRLDAVGSVGDTLAAHLSPLGAGNFCLESSTGAGCSGAAVGGTYAANTAYRINMFWDGTGGSHKMVVCNDSSRGTVLASLTNTGSTGAVNNIGIGISGEEPTTAGLTYDIRNVKDGTFSTSSCF